MPPPLPQFNTVVCFLDLVSVSLHVDQASLKPTEMSASGVLELEVHATASSLALLIFKKALNQKGRRKNWMCLVVLLAKALCSVPIIRRQKATE